MASRHLRWEPRPLKTTTTTTTIWQQVETSRLCWSSGEATRCDEFHDESCMEVRRRDRAARLCSEMSEHNRIPRRGIRGDDRELSYTRWLAAVKGSGKNQLSSRQGRETTPSLASPWGWSWRRARKARRGSEFPEKTIESRVHGLTIFFNCWRRFLTSNYRFCCLLLFLDFPKIS